MANHIIIPGQPPGCPLCPKKMVEAMVGDTLVYRCYEDKISIDARDPAIDRWNLGGEDAIPCAHCNSDMNYFIRSDGYMKAHCPKCHAEVETLADKEE